MPKRIEIDWTKGSEVEPEDLKAGEWYYWETSGFGPSDQVFQKLHQAGLSLVQTTPGKSLQVATMSLDYCKRELPRYQEAKRFGSYNGVMPTSRVFQLKQPPSLEFSDFAQEIVYALPRPASGCDPEVFVEDSSGEVIPAWEFLPAKKDPIFLKPNLIFFDGFQAEFTPQPSTCLDLLANAIWGQLPVLHHLMPKGSRISARGVVEVSAKTLRSAKSEYVEFGCRPSLNAYGLEPQTIPNPREFNLRFAGGHIHWGTAYAYSGYADYPARVVEAVKFLDATIGLAGVSLFERLDNPIRRRYYGLAGEYRLPKHGLEYRVLSNAWLATPGVYHLLFTIGRQALKLGFEGYREKICKLPEAAVVQAINNSDVQLARTLLGESQELWRDMCEVCFPDALVGKFTLDFLQHPQEDFGVHMSDCRENWATRVSVSYPERWIDFVTRGGKSVVLPAQTATQPAGVPGMLGNAGASGAHSPRNPPRG